MTGGLLNLVANGNQNLILNGNPTKTFFKCAYLKYTNFGMQKYRIDFIGERQLQLNELSKFSFKIPRYSELLLDAYLVIRLPDIWSSFFSDNNPYEFKWIKHIGSLIIENVSLHCGGQILQQFSGEYLKNKFERNDNENKIKKFYKMSGHTEELNDPEKIYNGFYPNVKVNSSQIPEPSIKGRNLYIPLPFWFSNTSKNAFPLVCLQYSDLYIDVSLKPIHELFTVLDITQNNPERVKPNLSDDRFQLYRFLQPPNSSNEYDNKPTNWNSDVHLVGTYVFLSEEEALVFAKNEQKYLFLDVKETLHKNIVGTQRIKIESSNLTSNFFWFFRRDDSYKRNEWTNYSNWKYENVPNVSLIDYNNYKITQYPDINNSKKILERVSFNFDGTFREQEMSSDIYSYIENYSRCNGSPNDLLYTYSFGINTSYEIQPSGAINLGMFKEIYLDIQTIIPNIDETQDVATICDEDGQIIGTIDIDPNKLYTYSFDMKLFEEKYNVLRFISGNVSLIYSR